MSRPATHYTRINKQALHRDLLQRVRKAVMDGLTTFDEIEEGCGLSRNGFGKFTANQDLGIPSLLMIKEWMDEHFPLGG